MLENLPQIRHKEFKFLQTFFGHRWTEFEAGHIWYIHIPETYIEILNTILIKYNVDVVFGVSFEILYLFFPPGDSYDIRFTSNSLGAELLR